jgi:hypothetical protein
VRFTEQDEANAMKIVRTEEELTEHLRSNAPYRLQAGRIRLPRLLANDRIFWPISEAIADHWHLNIERRIADPHALLELLQSPPIAEVRAGDLSAVWDPLPLDHPIHQSPNWPYY